jgi:hypothetical protein
MVSGRDHFQGVKIVCFCRREKVLLNVRDAGWATALQHHRASKPILVLILGRKFWRQIVLKVLKQVVARMEGIGCQSEATIKFVL